MTASTNYAAMGKTELRAACKAAGIQYSKLTTAQQREALQTAANIKAQLATDKQDETAATLEDIPSAFNPFAALAGKVEVPAFTGHSVKASDGKVVEAKPETPKHVPRPRVERTPAPYVPPVVRKGYKIQKERPMQNGVKRPSEGTVCEAVWSIFDALHNSAKGLCAGDLPALSDEHGWNRTNVSCEYYVWRKFNGISGRK